MGKKFNGACFACHCVCRRTKFPNHMTLSSGIYIYISPQIHTLLFSCKKASLAEKCHKRTVIALVTVFPVRRTRIHPSRWFTTSEPLLDVSLQFGKRWKESIVFPYHSSTLGPEQYHLHLEAVISDRQTQILLGSTIPASWKPSLSWFRFPPREGKAASWRCALPVCLFMNFVSEGTAYVWDLPNAVEQNWTLLCRVTWTWLN